MYSRINILAGSLSYNENKTDYWWPINLINFLFEKKYKISFYNSISEEFYNAEYVFLSSRKMSSYSHEKILEILFNLKKKSIKVIWFDLRDSAGTTQFEYLPFIDLYVKKQLYNDLSFYKKSFYGGRIYSDFYYKKFGITDKNKYKMTLLKDKYKKKVILGWNIGVRNFFYYSKNRLARLFYTQNKIKLFREKYKKFDLFMHNNLEIDRNSVRYQRELVYKKIDLGRLTNSIILKKIPRSEFYKTLKKTKILISLFGWGEICYKEFEATYMGCAFIMPNMCHINTWPNLYEKNVTYIPISWNLDNINENLEYLIKNDDLRNTLVHNAQKVILEIRNEKGTEYFRKFFSRVLDL